MAWCWRTIYQRILTWVINKISRTILKAAFVAIAFVVTGKFVVSAFAMLLLTFMTDFAKIARERRWFWHTMPSKALVAALVADVLIGTALTFVGLPGLMPLPWWQTLTTFVFAMVACLGVNDAIKVAMIKWRIPAAALG